MRLLARLALLLAALTGALAPAPAQPVGLGLSIPQIAGRLRLSRIGGTVPTSFATAMTFDLHPNTASISVLGGSATVVASVTAAGAMAVSSVTSGSPQLGMTLMVGGPAAQNYDARIIACPGGVCGGTGTYTLAMSATATAFASGSTLTFSGANVVTNITDPASGLSFAPPSVIYAPLQMVDGYGRKWLWFDRIASNHALLTNTTLAGIDNNNFACWAVVRFHGNGSNGSGLIIGGNPGGTVQTLWGNSSLGYDIANATNAGAPFPTYQGVNFVPSGAPLATRSRLILGAQPQVIGVAAVDAAGYLGAGTTSSTQVRMYLNETAYQFSAVTTNKTSGTGLIIGSANLTGTNSQVDMSIGELACATGGQMGTSATYASRADAAQAAMVYNWQIPSIRARIITAADSRWDYNYMSGMKPAMMLTEPGGPYALSPDIEVTDVSVAGGVANVHQRWSNAPNGLLNSPLSSGRNVIAFSIGHNDQQATTSTWPFTTTTGLSAPRGHETFCGDQTGCSTVGAAVGNTFTATVTGSQFAPVIHVTNFAGTYPIVATTNGMVINCPGLPAGASFKSYVASSGTNGGNGDYNITAYASIPTAVSCTGSWATYASNVIQWQNAGDYVLALSFMDPVGTTAGYDVYNGHVITDLVNMVPYPAKLRVWDLRQITISGIKPFGANFVGGSTWVLPDQTHMTDQGRRLLEGGGESGSNMKAELNAILQQ